MILHVAGAGMAGLCAAARARELGLDVVVYEKGDRPGGSMLLSSCVVWRYRSFEEFRAECPGGDPELQRQVIEHTTVAVRKGHVVEVHECHLRTDSPVWSAGTNKGTTVHL